jgi:hypothetical protein
MFHARVWAFAGEAPEGLNLDVRILRRDIVPALVSASLRPIEEHIRPSADHFLSMTFPFCGWAFFPSGIGTADEAIAFGKKSLVYLSRLLQASSVSGSLPAPLWQSVVAALHACSKLCAVQCG